MANSNVPAVVEASPSGGQLASDFTEMAAAKEMVGKILKKAELAAAELIAAEMRLLAAATEESGESDVDEKRKNLLNLEEIIRSLAQSVAYMLKEWEVADAKCGKLEEEWKSVMHEKDLLKRCCEDDKHLAEKLVREMEVMKREKVVDVDILKAENKANASKISALEEMCGFLKEIRSQLENKLEELKEEKLESVAYMLKEWEVSDDKCGKLEEVLRTVMQEKDLLKRCCEDDKHLAEKLVREMEVMRRDMDVLKAENKANASKISALEEMRGFLKEIRSQLENRLEEVKEEKLELVVSRSHLENKLEELKEEKLELVASYSEIGKKFVKVEENVERNLSEFKLEIEKSFDLKEKELTFEIKELKEKIAKMAVEKNLADQRNANYVSNLQKQISELRSTRNSLVIAQMDEIGAVEEDMVQKALDTAALRRQLQKLTRAKKNLENRVNYMNYKILKAW